MRILLPQGEQNKLMLQILEKISITKAAQLCDLSERTIRDWRREKFLLDKEAMELLCHETKVPLPKKYTEKKDYWSLDSSSGYRAAIEKNVKFGGNSQYRKEKWREWWMANSKIIIKSHPIFKRHRIRKPGKSKLLAEFFGIMLGDGSISSASKNQLRITLNDRDDKEYISFVLTTLEKLFQKKASIIKHKNAFASDICLSSTNAVDFLLRLGLKSGNKIRQQVDIPNWIKSNVEFQKACVRGLIDTDGCIFYECHNVKGKKYCYPRLTFVTASAPLRDSVFSILKNLNLEPKIENTRHVSIENKEKIKEYFKVIGSSNPKHLNRYYK